MRKNKMMRAASGLLVATLLTTSVISGTFAKYTTSASGEDSARVATWGFNDSNSLTLTNLFSNTYDRTVTSNETDNDDVIAPGTKGEATFAFKYSGAKAAPEVAYTFNVSADGSTCDNSIKENDNIVWSLDGTVAAAVTNDNGNTTAKEGSWDALIAAIEALDGNKAGDRYEANELPKGFDTTTTHTVSWEWKFDDSSTTKDNVDNAQNVKDTAMGNAAKLDQVKLKITIKATQID